MNVYKTCCSHHGMKIGDIGGMGEFTPDGYRNRYYIKGVGTNNGTMRWRPPFTMEEVEALGTKNRLFNNGNCYWESVTTYCYIRNFPIVF